MKSQQPNTLLRLLRLFLCGALLCACAGLGDQTGASTMPLSAPANRSAPAIGDWAMEGHGPDRGRATADNLPLPTGLVATYEVGGDTQFGSPVSLAQGTLFADGEQVLYALDAADGQERWRFNLPGFFLSPAVADGRIYVRAESGEDGYLYALTWEGGKLWQYRFPAVGSSYDNVGGHVTSPVVVDERVLVGASQTLFALAGNTGAVLWEFALQNPVASSAAVADGIVYISDFTRLYAVSVTEGAELWHFDFEPLSLFFAPVILADQVIITSSDTVYSLNRMTGALLWKKQLAGLEVIPAGAAGEQIFVKSVNNLVALRALDGEEIWRHTTLNFLSLPAVTDDYLFVVDRYGEGSQLLAIGRKDGQEVWRSESALLARSAPAVGSGKIFVRTEDGRILGYQ